MNRHSGINKKGRYPPNFGTYLGLLGGILATIGDGLATVGVAIDLEQSQLDDVNNAQQSQSQNEEFINMKKQLKALENEVRLLKETNPK
ncbi:hypothetical protein [Alkalicoccobacillus murimartini]|uniref:Holin n=1 Tax=Alkalicoccobacillus murimartini TaxID=171685 RepID=A0ABT9YLF9_9BACI|nr:hypothetical protein [Alkalicoccobacillus murimartini]MDQ0208716.1 hypothetical protein [Alkalicoccobacillus murimartini]